MLQLAHTQMCVYMFIINTQVLAKMGNNSFYILLWTYRFTKTFWRAVWLYLEEVTSTRCKITIPLLDYIPWDNYWTSFMGTARILQLFFFSKQCEAKNNVHQYTVQSIILCLTTVYYTSFKMNELKTALMCQKSKLDWHV